MQRRLAVSVGVGSTRAGSRYIRSVHATLVLLILGACAGSIEHPINTELLQPRLAKSAIDSACSAGDDNEIRFAPGVETNAPVAVLSEEWLHGVGPPQPTVAVWADGRVEFLQVVVKRWERSLGAIPASSVAALTHEVAQSLAAAPRVMNVFGNDSESDRQATTIVVRDGSRWIGARVYGAHESDFLEVAAASDPQPPTTTVDGFGDVGYRPPKPFAEAYRRLLASRPNQGRRAEPYDYDVTFYPAELYSPHYLTRSEITWPHELPMPPPSLSPEQCDHDGMGCPFVLDARYREAGTRFYQRLRSQPVGPIVLVRGRRFQVGFDELYPGERSIDALIECVGQLGHAHE
jgi:hypothetical protein